MAPPLNLTINLYEQEHFAQIGESCQSKTATEQKKRAAWLDFHHLNLIWGNRLLPEVGPGFKVFREEFVSMKEPLLGPVKCKRLKSDLILSQETELSCRRTF